MLCKSVMEKGWFEQIVCDNPGCWVLKSFLELCWTHYHLLQHRITFFLKNAENQILGKKSHQLMHPAILQCSCCGTCSLPWATHWPNPLEMTPEEMTPLSPQGTVLALHSEKFNVGQILPIFRSIWPSVYFLPNILVWHGSNVTFCPVSGQNSALMEDPALESAGSPQLWLNFPPKLFPIPKFSYWRRTCQSKEFHRQTHVSQGKQQHLGSDEEEFFHMKDE